MTLKMGEELVEIVGPAHHITDAGVPNAPKWIGQVGAGTRYGSSYFVRFPDGASWWFSAISVHVHAQVVWAYTEDRA